MYKNIILNDSSNFTISGMRDVVDIVREKMGADMAEIGEKLINKITITNPLKLFNEIK